MPNGSYACAAALLWIPPGVVLLFFPSYPYMLTGQQVSELTHRPVSKFTLTDGFDSSNAQSPTSYLAPSYGAHTRVDPRYRMTLRTVQSGMQNQNPPDPQQRNQMKKNESASSRKGDRMVE